MGASVFPVAFRDLFAKNCLGRSWGYDTLVIILTKPVLDEIDKHKKSTGSTRSRALEIFGRIREMLTTGRQEVDIRSSAPRVILRRIASARPDQDLKDQLD
jgi:hypothetical protein